MDDEPDGDRFGSQTVPATVHIVEAAAQHQGVVVGRRRFAEAGAVLAVRRDAAVQRRHHALAGSGQTRLLVAPSVQFHRQLL